jgi:hypothetical protein
VEIDPAALPAPAQTPGCLEFASAQC